MRLGAMFSQLLHSLFRKPATVCYPREKLPSPDKTRGALSFDPKACIGCRMCERDCPAGAIKIIKYGENQFEAQIRLDKCIYCGQCVDSCVKKALRMTLETELASPDKDKLKAVFREKPAEGTPEKAG